jgi:transcriptional regulator with XRE-family HTH domain
MIVSKARLGAEVARRRAAAGLGVGELAKLAGLAEAVVSAIERGEHRAGPRELQAVAEALGVDELDLLRRPTPGYLILPGAETDRADRSGDR